MFWLLQRYWPLILPPDILFGMSASLEKPAFNPYAAPVASSTSADSEMLPGNRASQEKLRAVNLLYIIAELSYLAVCGAYFMLTFFAAIGTFHLAWIAFCVTSVVLWFSTSAGLIRACGFGIKTILMVLLLPLPLLGTIIFLGAKEDMRLFMISNGYLPGFLGFYADVAERKAMEQDPDYRPSIYFRRDGSRRRRTFTIGACLIIICVLGLAGLVLFSTCVAII